MLLVCDRLSGLNWSELMAVYAEGVAENGREFYPELPEMQQILQSEQDFYDYLKRDFFRCRQERYCIWVENGRYVSALRLHPFEDGLLIEGLETRPEDRKKGFASELLRAVLNEIGKQKVYSHISRRNRASIATHHKFGFRKFLDYARYCGGEINTYCDTYLYER